MNHRSAEACVVADFMHCETARMDKITVSPEHWRPGSANQWFQEGSCLRVGHGTSEWTEAAWQCLNADPVDGFRHVVIEASVSGQAGAAGLSFGAYKDFLTSQNGDRTRLLQLEIDRAEGWRFRVDGVLQCDQWWNSAVSSGEDLWCQPLLLKARWPENVFFEDVTLYRLASAPSLSIVIICHRFAQRLRASLASWCRQDIGPGAYEVLVVNPGSADATHEVVADAAASFPTVRITEIEADHRNWRNKGMLINLASNAARGEWVLLTDADCLFDKATVASILRSIVGLGPRIFFGERRHLRKRTTQAILAGAIDAVCGFNQLVTGQSYDHVDRSPWGYAQLVPREILRSVRYREDVDHYAHTDEIFVSECQRRGLTTQFLENLICLHLEHPFAWYGTNQFL
jgi:Glycosyl transferase family 2